MVPITAQPTSDSFPADDFAGLKFTDDQKAKIDEIHRKMNSNREVVARAKYLTSDAKDAMIQGYSRIERSQIFDVLTPEQKKEILRRIRARKAAPVEKKQVPPPLK
jgi:Spy/CpxP family protein refolding chaperone